MAMTKTEKKELNRILQRLDQELEIANKKQKTSQYKKSQKSLETLWDHYDFEKDKLKEIVSSTPKEKTPIGTTFILKNGLTEFEFKVISEDNISIYAAVLVDIPDNNSQEHFGGNERLYPLNSARKIYEALLENGFVPHE